MSILLTGFKDLNGERRFSFDCVAKDRSRIAVTVGANMASARKHNIRIQELPLHCVRLIEALGNEEAAGALTLTEDV